MTRSLVLLPGFMCDAELWRDMVPDLETLGLLHYGNVYRDDTLEGMARRVLAEAPGRFVLVGFSMGGFVARVLTLMAPERVTGVAFIASSAREYSEAERERRRAGALPGDRPRKASPGVALGLHPDRETDPLLLDRLRSMQRRLGPEVRTRQAALIRKDGYADLERIAGSISPRQKALLRVHRKDGETIGVPVILRLDTPAEVEYYRQNGLLPGYLRTSFKTHQPGIAS